MTVPTHFKFTFRGIFKNTPEIWSFGFHMQRDQPAGPDADVGQVNSGQVTTAITTFMHDASAPLSSLVQLTDWRCYQIGTSGRMEGNPKIVDLTASNIVGLATNAYPPQIALAVTTVAANRGPARFGRFFIPGPTATVGTDMRISAGAATGYCAAAAKLLKDVSNAVDLPNTVLSAAGLNISHSPAPNGTKQQIDHVECGRVLDTLRSRRGKMLEERVSQPHIDW